VGRTTCKQKYLVRSRSPEHIFNYGWITIRIRGN